MAHAYDAMVGNSRLERETPLARARYVASAREFLRALTQFSARGVPIDPGPDSQVREWTAQDVAVLRAVHETLGRMLDSRRNGDHVRSGQQRLPSGRPPVEGQPTSTSRRVAAHGMENSMWADLRPDRPPEER